MLVSYGRGRFVVVASNSAILILTAPPLRSGPGYRVGENRSPGRREGVTNFIFANPESRDQSKGLECLILKPKAVVTYDRGTAYLGHCSQTFKLRRRKFD